MTSLCVPFIDTEKQDLETALELGGARFDVQCANWPETFPYTPFCGGRVARTKDALVVDFRVSGLDLRAQNTEDNGRQWEDSCVEVFIQDPEKADYYNFEINALGKVLACYGPVREGRTRRPQEQMEQILRFGHLEGGPLDKDGIQTWRVGVVIPFELIRIARFEGPQEYAGGIWDWRVTVLIPFELVGVDPENLPEKLRANFYKCGDKTAHPHYVSWSPIDTPKPDFHRPDFFGELILK